MTGILRKYRNMVLISLLFFYLGCGITLCLIRIDCTSTQRSRSEKSINTNFGKIEYAVLVISSPGNEMKRDAIRSTWVNFADNIFEENGERLYKWNYTWTGRIVKLNIIKTFFVIGIHNLHEDKVARLNVENSRGKDLLLLDNVEDNYKNLALKLSSSLKWLSNNLEHLKYVIKCDDDSFVRIDLLVKDLEAFAPEMNGPTISSYVSLQESRPAYKGLYWGYFDGRAKVQRNGKWQEKDWFLCDKYLPYALGGGYVISRSIVDYVAHNYNFLSHYSSEDVSMGVWTAALDGINRVHDTRFDTIWKSRGCESNMLIRHKQSPSDMFHMFTTLVNSRGKKLCKTDYSIIKFYNYNWNVLPSGCCRKDRNPEELK